MEENIIKVYVKVDSNNVITSINSDIFTEDITEWIKINEGTGDKYSHAQSNYLDKGLMDSNGQYNYKLVDGKVVERTENEKINLDLLKQIKINELSQRCNETITNGFYSDADGTKKLYDFELENQVNLSTKAYQIQIAKLAGQSIGNISYYAKGETCHDYTAEQFLKLSQDGENWKTANIVKYKDDLKQKVMACTTKDDIDKIIWESILI
ncbi:hypothetical protein OD350_00065 [Clostridium beijerinckii]|uniref:DUF4376 domain-containing protein n=1 Tax=Clostridium beijerinckii TaxID=1520 RepID=UPI0015712428|nr:hypothetical protein [Clostridium beijerinckii]NRT33263.1 hypothetical protein [Clostridium beijerinckii]NRT47311.1 hypothetical protein [Clostridium beijerinckii]NRZ18684.1 hypothetical protein [Clostridium beijerinckii]UYZ36082.1 hypothetical protein OD350_00065 [Clostridium beijerinckii]